VLRGYVLGRPRSIQGMLLRHGMRDFARLIVSRVASRFQFLVYPGFLEKALNLALPVTPFTLDRAHPTVVGSTLGENNCSLVRFHSFSPLIIFRDVFTLR
jgi:hypothetical protein